MFDRIVYDIISYETITDVIFEVCLSRLSSYSYIYMPMNLYLFIIFTAHDTSLSTQQQCTVS